MRQWGGWTMTISQQLSTLLFDYRSCHATEQDVIRGVAVMTSAARVDRLETALRRLIEESEIFVLIAQDEGRDLLHLRQKVSWRKEALYEHTKREDGVVEKGSNRFYCPKWSPRQARWDTGCLPVLKLWTGDDHLYTLEEINPIRETSRPRRITKFSS